MNSFTEIPNDVIETLVKQSEYKKISQNVPKYYNLILTGSVGAGKSTLSQLTYECFKKLNIKVQIYPEYIQYQHNNQNIGNLMLELRRKNIIDTETLQHFILDIWNYQLNEKKFNEHNSINILERLPDDALYCFCKEAYEQNIISQESYYILCQKYKHIIDKHKVPVFRDCKLAIVENDNLMVALNQILEIIHNDFNNGIENRMIGLITDEKRYIQRIKQRGRISEIETDLEIFKHYNQFYDNMYNEMMN